MPYLAHFIGRNEYFILKHFIKLDDSLRELDPLG